MRASFPRAGVIARALGLIALTALPTVAAPVETPDAFVRRVYARYRAEDGPGVMTTRPEGTPFYAPALLDAYARDAETDGATVDWDPICACQAYRLRLTSIVVSGQETGTATARVGFTNLGSRHSVVLSLLRTPAGWRIADVGDADNKSIVALLKASAEHAKASAGTTKP